jgi:hypothetical protein
MCGHLRDIGCNWDASACNFAAASGYIDTLRWLRENGCPWNATHVFTCAARDGCIDILDYMLERGEVTDAQQWTKALEVAGINGELQAAQWLRQHCAEWPDVLSVVVAPNAHQWPDELIAWARAEGCTSPTTV